MLDLCGERRTDARKIFVNPKKRIVKFEFVTLCPMRGWSRELMVQAERELRGGTGGMGLDFKLAGRWGKHKTDILSDIKLFRAFCLKLAGVVFIDLTHPSQRLKLSRTKIHHT